MPTRKIQNEKACDFVKRTIVETRSPYIIKTVVAYLDALERHPARDRLYSEMIDEWYSSEIGGDYRTETKRSLEEKISKWWIKRGMSRLPRKLLLPEVAKWFWMEHRVGFGREIDHNAQG